MASAKDSFFDLERHRRKLEENVERLSKALDHWKQWKREYETLRSDLESLSPSASQQDLRHTREKFQGDLLNEKELGDIFGRGDSKKAEQVISTLTNRLDYVTRNITTLGKQLGEAENKLAAVTIVMNPDATDEEGLPITEIMEELDDDDNVVSFSLRTAGDSQPQIMEALRKAGITDLPSTNNRILDVGETGDAKSGSAEDGPSPPPAQPNGSHVHDSKNVSDPPKESRVEERTEAKPQSKKKGVTFSEDTKPAQEPEQSETAKRLEEILQKARDQQSMISDPIFPADESPEDASLREDMIRYNKETMEYEMAPIVAELQLEEGSTGDDTDDYSDYDEDEDDEDEWGKTKLAVDDDWKQRMLELKERLSNYDFNKNEGPDDDEEMVEGIGRISIRREGGDGLNGDTESRPNIPPNTEDLLPTQDEKKSVRFAQSLDIAEAPTPALKQTSRKESKKAEVEPLSDVMERSSGAAQPVSTQSRKVSRFKKTRSNGVPINSAPISLDGTPILPERPDAIGKPTPSGPEGRTLADSVPEHEPSLEVKEPDEFDANLLQKQATEEYYKMRNKLVYRQGGFMKENENAIQPLDEEEGGPKRMSRFKAARLAKS